MSEPEIGILMLGMLVFLIMLGFPIAFTLIAMGIGFGYFAIGDIIFPLLVQRAYGVMSNDVLIAVPLFLFMGYMVERANILDRLFSSLLLAGLYILYVMGRAMLNPKVAPRLSAERLDVPLGQVYWGLLTSFVPLFVLIMAVLGAILFGLATPHEAAGIGALGAILLAAIYRQLTFARLREAVFLTARTSAMVCWLFVGSWIFSSVFSLLDGHSLIEHWISGLSLTPLQFLLLAQLMIFILGWPLEWTEIIIIFVPIFLPLLHMFGIDPLFFGVLVALNIQTSFLTPPMAMSAFYLKGIAPKGIELNDIFIGIAPFLLMVFLAMFILYMVPGIVFWLPGVLYG